MKLHFLFFIAADSTEVEEFSTVDESWKNTEAFKLPKAMSFQTERAEKVEPRRGRNKRT